MIPPSTRQYNWHNCNALKQYFHNVVFLISVPPQNVLQSLSSNNIIFHTAAKYRDCKIIFTALAHRQTSKHL